MLRVLALVYIHRNLGSAGYIEWLSGAGIARCLGLRGDVRAPSSIEIAESLAEDHCLGVGKLEHLIRVLSVVL